MISLIKKIKCNEHLQKILTNLKYAIIYSRDIFKKNLNNTQFPKLDSFKKKYIIIFMPEFGLNAHAQYATELFRCLSKLKKYNILFTKCFDNFNQCMIKKYNPHIFYKFQKGHCFACTKNFFKNVPFKDNVINLDYISDKYFDQSYKLDKKFMSNEIEEFSNFKYNSIEVANLSFFDHLIMNREYKINPSKKQIEKIKESVSSNIKLVNCFDYLNSKIDISHIFMIDEYSPQSTLKRWAENKKIKTFNFQSLSTKSDDLEIFSSSTWAKRGIDCIDVWSKYNKLNLSQYEINRAYQDLTFRTVGRGGHVFSSNYKKNFSKTLVENLGLSQKKKTIGLFTSSSDEERAYKFNMEVFYPWISNKDAFKNQLEWIDKTISWVEKNRNLQLVIGVHPRLFRGSNLTFKQSAELVELKKRYFNRKYEYNNVKIIWPEQEISTYNIFELIDVAVVAWTSLANQLSLFGIPVITGLEGNFRVTPNFEGIIKVESKDAYFNEISKKLNLGYNDLKISTLISSVKWSCLLNYGHEIYTNKLKHRTLDLEKILEGKTTILNERLFYKEKNKKINTKTIQDKSLKKCISNLAKVFSQNNNKNKLTQRLKELEIKLNI